MENLVLAPNFLAAAADMFCILALPTDHVFKIMMGVTALNHINSGSTNMGLASETKKGFLMTTNFLSAFGSGFIIMLVPDPASQAIYISKCVVQAMTMLYAFFK